MRRVEVDKDSLMAIADASVTLSELAETANHVGLLSPPHPGDESAPVGAPCSHKRWRIKSSEARRHEKLGQMRRPVTCGEFRILSRTGLGVRIPSPRTKLNIQF